MQSSQQQVSSAEGISSVSGASSSSVANIPNPVAAAVKKAATGLITVIRGSRSAHVTAMESTPLSGVDTRNAPTAPLPAPWRLSSAAVGSTEQLQRGRGTPSKAALKTDIIRFSPRCFLTNPEGRKAFKNPDARKPKSMNGADATRTDQAPWRIVANRSIIEIDS